MNSEFSATSPSSPQEVDYLNDDRIPTIGNLLTSNNLTWAEVIDYTKTHWDIVDNIRFDYKNNMNFKDNKKILRYLTKFIPSNYSGSIERTIKRNKLLLNLTQIHISNINHINTIFRVKRHSEISNQNKVDEKFFKYLKSLSENAFNYRLK